MFCGVKGIFVGLILIKVYLVREVVFVGVVRYFFVCFEVDRSMEGVRAGSFGEGYFMGCVMVVRAMF